MTTQTYIDAFERLRAVVVPPENAWVAAHGRWLPNKPYPFNAYAAIAAGKPSASFHPAWLYAGKPYWLQSSYGAVAPDAVAIGESQLYTAMVGSDPWQRLLEYDAADWVDAWLSWGGRGMTDEAGVVDDPAAELAADIRHDAENAAKTAGAGLVVVLAVALAIVVLART